METVYKKPIFLVLYLLLVLVLLQSLEGCCPTGVGLYVVLLDNKPVDFSAQYTVG